MIGAVQRGWDQEADWKPHEPQNRVQDLVEQVFSQRAPRDLLAHAIAGPLDREAHAHARQVNGAVPADFAEAADHNLRIRTTNIAVNLGRGARRTWSHARLNWMYALSWNLIALGIARNGSFIFQITGGLFTLCSLVASDNAITEKLPDSLRETAQTCHNLAGELRELAGKSPIIPLLVGSLLFAIPKHWAAPPHLAASIGGGMVVGHVFGSPTE